MRACEGVTTAGHGVGVLGWGLDRVRRAERGWGRPPSPGGYADLSLIVRGEGQRDVAGGADPRVFGPFSVLSSRSPWFQRRYSGAGGGSFAEWESRAVEESGRGRWRGGRGMADKAVIDGGASKEPT
jgi:hypothetical protein